MLQYHKLSCFSLLKDYRTFNQLLAAVSKYCTSTGKTIANQQDVEALYRQSKGREFTAPIIVTSKREVIYLTNKRLGNVRGYLKQNGITPMAILFIQRYYRSHLQTPSSGYSIHLWGTFANV